MFISLMFKQKHCITFTLIFNTNLLPKRFASKPYVSQLLKIIVSIIYSLYLCMSENVESKCYNRDYKEKNCKLSVKRLIYR